MTFQTLALICGAALLGPVLATPNRWRVPVLLGELAVGVALGGSGIRVLRPHDRTFTFLADIGFALVMFVAGSHVPLRDARLRGSLQRGALRAVGVGGVAVAAGWLLSRAFGTGHAALYTVLLASSSAAVILPMLDSVGLTGPETLDLIAQVAIADTACVVALPLVIDPHRAGSAAVGAVVVAVAATVAFLGLRAADRSGLRRRVHHFSERREFALELRISLLAVFILASIASATHVSIMLAGFSLGLVATAVGEPRRLARQLFGLTEGFLGPLFFVWMGATLDLRALGSHPQYIGLGLAIGGAAVLCHACLRLLGQPLVHAVISAAQMGVPIAAVALGVPSRLLRPGESAALLLGALVTLGSATVAAAHSGRTAGARP